ncbi:MAG TPA: transglycosylase domain-containing protein [Flavobacteriaceae bacterium]|nr:transglycosylase domain-containing protein [Flavobacteriaceae bacterium]
MKSRKKKVRYPWIKWSLITIGTFFILALLFFWSIYLGAFGEIPSKKRLVDLKQSQATEVIGVNGELIGKYYFLDRQSIPFGDMPQHLIDALIATEDMRFYEHEGIDKKSLLRVFFKSILLSDESAGGGSTITLQLAKNLFGRNDYGFGSIVINKLRESIIARRIEDIYSKEEILHLYLNTVPFSGNTYGIESASRKFYNIPARELSLSQAATLIGTLKANHSYDPKLFPEASKSRRNTVLKQMMKYGYISKEKGKLAMQKPLVLDYQYFEHNKGLAPYFREAVKQQVVFFLDQVNKNRKTDYNIYTDGLKVYTTLDAKMQTLAEESMRQHLENLQQQFENAYGKKAPWLTEKKILEDAIKNSPIYLKMQKQGLSNQQIMDSLKRPKEMELFYWKGDSTVTASSIDSLRHYLKLLNVGMIAVDPSSGAVRAYIGGIDHRSFKYDHVNQSERQVGSAFKPIVYTAALEAGIEPCSYFPIKPVTYTDFNNWTPTNSSSRYDQELSYSMKFALSHSINTIAVKVLRKTGIENVIEQARKMGIDSKIEKVPSIALGTVSMSVQELAKAYTTFVNNSHISKPFYILKIENKAGEVLFEHKVEESHEKAFSEETRQTMVEMMKATVNHGTAVRLRSEYNLNNDLAGKTGTTQNNKDAWFVSVMPKLVTVTWVGNDDHRIGFSSTAIGQGANAALPIFANLLQKMNADPYFDEITQAHFKKPSEEVLAALDCEVSKRPGFFKRIFGGDDDKKKKFKKKEKKGFFGRLFGKKEKE